MSEWRAETLRDMTKVQHVQCCKRKGALVVLAHSLCCDPPGGVIPSAPRAVELQAARDPEDSVVFRWRPFEEKPLHAADYCHLSRSSGHPAHFSLQRLQTSLCVVAALAEHAFLFHLLR